MTDKIINGVDVSGCEFYCDGCCTELTDSYGDYIDKCTEFNNCYYKQLKRKQRSEEKLVKQIQTICDFINNRPETFKGINGSVDKIITDYAERKEQEYEFSNLRIIQLQETLKQYEEENTELKNQRDQWISRCEQETKTKEFFEDRLRELELELNSLKKQECEEKDE